MIKMYKDSNKMTANQMAKYLVADAIDRAYYWSEYNEELYSRMTPKERQELDDAISKQAQRVFKLMNYSKLHKLIFNK